MASVGTVLGDTSPPISKVLLPVLKLPEIFMVDPLGEHTPENDKHWSVVKVNELAMVIIIHPVIELVGVKCKVRLFAEPYIRFENVPLMDFQLLGCVLVAVIVLFVKA